MLGTMHCKFLVVLVFLAVPRIKALSEEMQALIKNLHDTCTAETGVDEALITKVNAEKVLPDDAKLKCYLKCLMAQVGAIEDDGTIDVEGMIAMLPEDIKAKAEGHMRKCGPIAGSDACDAAFKTQTCWLNAAPEIYMLF